MLVSRFLGNITPLYLLPVSSDNLMLLSLHRTLLYRFFYFTDIYAITLQTSDVT